MKINEKQFSALCYLVLMNHHGQGYREAHPTYIQEKLSMLDSGWDAYMFLDREDQIAVLSYLTEWKYDCPDKIIKFEEYRDA